MGLGKTIQTITVILKLKNEGTLKNPVLIVVPASVLSNWDREIQRFAPSLSVVRHYGSSRFLASKYSYYIFLSKVVISFILMIDFDLQIRIISVLCISVKSLVKSMSF